MTGRLQDLQRSFARHLRAEGTPDRTIALYGQAIRFFSEWLEAQGREPVLEELNRAAIREWLAQLADTREPSTVKLRYRGLFRFCGWLVDEGELPEHPMKTLSPPQPKATPSRCSPTQSWPRCSRRAPARSSATAATRP